MTDAGLHVSRSTISHRLYRPIVLEEPDRIVEPASWIEHIPFAFWIVEAHRPKVLVELGTHSGNSYAAFAQAVQTLRLPTACYAVDTWKGDPHSGHYDEAVFDEWREYHDRRYSSFSRLVRDTFSEAVEHFAPESIDLLHIDGYHTFDAVERDFATWLPKLSQRAVVLLHDINVREGDFGAWKLWRQLEMTYPAFAFLHGHGLGVLAVGGDISDDVRWLVGIRPDSPEAGEVRSFFSRLGRHVSAQDELRRRLRSVRDLEARLADLEAQEVAERAQRDRALADVELSRENGRACLDYAIRQQESQLQAAQTKHAEAIRDLENRLREECSRRDRTILELDAEARSLASLVDAVRSGSTGASARRRGRGARGPSGATSGRSALGQIMTSARAAVAVLPRALRSGSLRDRARNVAFVARQPRRAVSAYVIARSGLFDARAYASRYPDVAQSGVDPLLHYTFWGAGERRSPHPLFDTAFYLDTYPDVARAGQEPFSHFLTTGGCEGRSPGPHFDSGYYLESNPDVRTTGANPLVHFVTHGWREGRNPSASFDSAEYLASHDDVRAAGVNPLVHFVETGLAEGREVTAPSSRSVQPTPRIRLSSTSLSPARPDPPLIVCLTHVCPWPPHAGNSYRLNRLLLRLQDDGYRIVPIIVPLGGEMPDAASIRKVEELFSNVVIVDRNGPIRYALRDVPDVLASLDGEHTPRYSAVLGEDRPLTGRARELLTTDRTYCPDAAIAALLRLHSALGHYVLLTEYVWMTRALPLVDGRALKVIDTHDLYSLKAEKVLKFGIQDLWLEPEEEARRLRLADLIIAIQDDEAALLRRLAPKVPVVTAGIDFRVTGDPRLPDAHRVLLIGSGNAMNVRGLKEFLRFAWPAVRERVPDAELVVAGAVSEALGEKPAGVRALGRVDDVAELYRAARVIINPALAGTGLKIKTIEALCHLRPLVTWPTGTDGLPRELKALCDVAQDWYEFGPRVAARLMDGKREAFSHSERQAIERATTPDAVYAELSNTLREHRERRVAVSAARVGGS